MSEIVLNVWIARWCDAMLWKRTIPTTMQCQDLLLKKGSFVPLQKWRWTDDALRLQREMMSSLDRVNLSHSSSVGL